MMIIITATQTTFSIRSGGHDFNVNHSNVNSTGILVDMASFNSISLSTDRSNVTAGCGALWGDVYKVLNGTGVSVNGGKSFNPGVGGQTLGGGHGWFSDSAGVTAARVIAAEVVLGNGTVVQATEHHNSDLLWALRGGGPNFGVVTHFTYKTLAIDKVWYARWMYAPSKNQQLLNALVDYHRLAANDTKAAIVFQLSVDPASTASFVGFFYADAVEFPPVFAPFYAVKPDVVGIESTFGTVADLAFEYFAPQYPDAGVPPSRLVLGLHPLSAQLRPILATLNSAKRCCDILGTTWFPHRIS
jgi:FAD/FMN-containing dehydrogenase